MIGTQPSPVVSDQDAAALRRQSRGILQAIGLLGVPLVILGSVGVSEYQRTASLASEGIRAPAEVVGASYYSRASDRLRLAFATHDGRLIEASVPVGDLSRYNRGMTVEVAYDPANPRNVRTVEDWEPPYVFPFCIGGVLATVLALLALRAWRWPNRLRRVAARAVGGHPMVLSSVSVSGRAGGRWAVLREAGLRARPQLAFRLAEAADVPSEPVEVEVFGKRRRRMVGVVLIPTGMLWPAGKMRRPPRIVRRALDRAETAAASSIHGPSVPFATRLPDVRGDLPPLPPEFFVRAPADDRASPTKMVVALVPMLLAVTVPFTLPDIIEAHRHVCPTPPAAVSGQSGLLPADLLPASIPVALPGYTVNGERGLALESFANPPTQVALVSAGFTSGFEREFLDGSVSAKLEVFQFDDAMGPARYEAFRLATLCGYTHAKLAVPQGSGASGAIVGQQTGPLHRLTFVRGNRDYIVNLEGPGVRGGTDVLEHLLATAK